MPTTASSPSTTSTDLRPMWRTSSWPSRPTVGAVEPDGTVYVVWADVVRQDTQIRAAISYDGGKTFPNKAIKVASLATDNPFDDPLPGASFFGGTGLPSFAVGQDGVLYVSWGRRTNDHTVAMVVKSTDG